MTDLAELRRIAERGVWEPISPPTVLALLGVVEAAKDAYDDGGVDDIDLRLRYVVIQMGRSEWDILGAALSRLESHAD